MVVALVAGGSVARGLGGVFNVLKVAKAIRIARILRLLRILKVFKQIKYVSSPMAQRHTAKITTAAITATVLTFFAWSLLESGGLIPDEVEREFMRSQRVTAQRSAQSLTGASMERAEREMRRLLERNPNLLLVKRDGETVVSRYGNPELDRRFGPGDYGYLETGGFGFFFSRLPLERERAKKTLLFFVIIVAMVLTFLAYYSPHFAITVTDPIHVMVKGLSEPGYNLEVSVPPRYRGDDVFRLAQLYNEEYLPLKERMSEEEGPSQSDLSLSDLSGFLGGDGTDKM
jgi:hypothetical protein